jgi:hypothetical protein
VAGIPRASLHRAVAFALTCTACLALAACSDDAPEPADLVSEAVALESRLASATERLASDAGKPPGLSATIAELEELTAQVDELESQDAAYVRPLRRALRSATTAARDLQAIERRAAAAREQLRAPDTFDRARAPELRATATALERDATRVAGVRDTLAEATTALGSALAALGERPAEEIGAEAEGRESLAGLRRRLRSDTGAAGPARALRAALADLSAEARDRAAPHPYGALGPRAVGPVSIGMRSPAVRRAFGRPSAIQPVGFGFAPTPQIDWRWRTEPGFRLMFDTRTDRVAGYECARGCELRTADGIGVGDRFADLRSRYGDRLRTYRLGVGGELLSAGAPGSFPALIFSAPPLGPQGRIAAISGLGAQTGPAGD